MVKKDLPYCLTQIKDKKLKAEMIEKLRCQEIDAIIDTVLETLEKQDK